MSDRAALSHSFSLVKSRHGANGKPIRNGNALEKDLEVRCSWSPMAHAPETHVSNYAVILVDVNINVRLPVGNDCTQTDKRYKPTIIALLH